MALLNFIDGLFKGDKTKTKPPVRNSTATQKRYYADSSSVAIEERPYYQQDSYYTLVVHEGTQFEKKVIPFNERKTVTYPSKNGLYVPEILLLEYCKYGKYPKPSNGYPGFWWFDYGVRDVGSLLDSLRSREFIKWERKGNLLMNLNVNELREILRAHCLSTTGKKGELIERIKSDIAEEDLPNNVALQKYTLTEKGIEELKENAYVPYMHNHRHKTTDDSTFGEPFTVWEMNKIIAAEGRQKEWKTIVGEIEKQRFGVNMAGSQGTTQNLRTTQEVPSEKENKGEELKRFLRENRKNIIAAANTEGDGFFEESKGLDYCTIGNDKEALYQFYVAIEKKFDAPALYKETAKLLHKYGLYDEEVKILKKGVAIVPATNRHRDELLKMLQDAMTISKTR